MCVVCKSRLSQAEMLRLQCKNKEILPFNGIGRSFYICNDCINDKKLDKIIQRICKISKINKEIIRKIKEM